MQQVIRHGHSPLLCQGGRLLIRSRGRDGKSQLVLQGQAQLLMVGQPPVFPDRTTPMPVGAILPMDHHELNYPNLSLHLHRPVAPMHHLASAQGEKRRHDGRLLPAIVVGVSVASIPALRPLLPSQSHAMVGDLRAQYSSVSFGCGFSFYRMRNRSPLHYGGSVKMRPSSPPKKIEFSKLGVKTVLWRPGDKKGQRD